MSLIARYTVTASAGIMPKEIIATYISMPVPKNTKYTASAAVCGTFANMEIGGCKNASIGEMQPINIPIKKPNTIPIARPSANRSPVASESSTSQRSPLRSGWVNFFTPSASCPQLGMVVSLGFT